MSDDKVTLIPIAMVMPTKECIYAPSRIESSVQISQKQFVTEYADSAKGIQVSFAEDGNSDASTTTAYTNGGNSMLGRFIKK